MAMFILHEQSDVFVDACASDHHAQLLFVSVYGRDTSVQQLMARLHQSTSQGGVESLSLLSHHGAKPALQVLVGEAKRLQKTVGRMPKTGLLGNLVHAWIFDPLLWEVDHAMRSAWVFQRLDVMRTAQQGLEYEAWRFIKDLSPVPLLDAWAEEVTAHVRSAGGFVQPPVIGDIQTTRIELAEDFPQWVSEAVKQGSLPVPEAAHQAVLMLA
jgi:hypothetical protein